MKISIPATDLLKNQLTNPGWTNLILRKAEAAPSKDKQSTNFNFDFEVESSKKIIPRNFNSKALNMMEPLIAAYDGKEAAREAIKSMSNLDIDTDNWIGKRCLGKIVNNPVTDASGNPKGYLRDEIEAFLPEGTDTNSPF